MMKATNITASMAAATFSARRASQAMILGGGHETSNANCEKESSNASANGYIALIFSSIPGGQLLARSDARYFFCANSRNALTSGV